MSHPTLSPPVAQWFSRRRFGLFIHFGLYAIEGWHEQHQWRGRIPRHEYVKLMDRFNPTAFDPDAFIDFALASGMEYLCITTKHHDGFCLWDTEFTDYNIMNTPYGRDLIGQLAEACHRRAFPLGLYYSLPDWHHPNYPNEDKHHQLPAPLPGDEPDWDKYCDFVRNQVRELCTRYGPVKHFFWDVNVTEHRDPSMNDMLRQLQPDIVINNRGFDEGDFGTPEREFQATANASLRAFERPTEACNSVGVQSWGYRKNEDYYAPEFLISSMDAMMAKGAHYLLNVGPDPLGRIPPEAKAVIKPIADWYLKCKEAFGDAHPASHLTDASNVLLTQRGTTLYVHLQRPFKSPSVVLPPIDQAPQRATLLNTGQDLPFAVEMLPYFWSNRGTYLIVREIPLQDLGTETPIIKLEFDHPIEKRDTDYRFYVHGHL